MIKTSVTVLLLLMIVDFCKSYNLKVPESCRSYFHDSRYLSLNNIYDRVPFSTWQKIIYELYEQYPVPDLSIKITKHANISCAGLTGYLILARENLYQAAMDFIYYERLIVDYNSGSLKVKNDLIEFVWSDFHEKAGLLVDEVIVFTYIEIARQIIDPQELKLEKISFYYDKPENSDFYEKILGCPVHFNSPIISVVMSASHLESIRLPTKDPILYKILKQEANRHILDLPSNHDFEQRLEICIMHCIKEITLNNVANYLNISTHTLKNKLFKRKLNFNVCVNKVRKKLAITYLENEKLTINQVADLLGYSEQSAFQRAFKSWMNITPLQFRKNLKQEDIQS